MQNGLANKYYMGSQVNLSEIHISDQKLSKLNYHIYNTIEDSSFEENSPLPNTMDEEREAVELIAEVLDLPKKDCWGYVGEGSSLGNLQGMWMGSLLLKEATLVFSDSAHYSIFKFATCLNFKKVKVIKSHMNGEMDLEDLHRKINEKEKVVIVLTAGTTMTSAYDPVKDCTDILKSKSCEFYFHLDAALGGMIIPFLSQEQFPDKNEYTFKNKDISSMTISMHKVLSSSTPANIFLARQQVVQNFKNKTSHISFFNNMNDIEVYGSRDGLRAIAICELLRDVDAKLMNHRLTTNLGKAEKIVFDLKCIGVEDAFSHQGGLAVVIPLTSFNDLLTDEQQLWMQKKYNLIKSSTVVHIYMMDQVTDRICDDFISDFKALKEQNKVLELV